MVGFVAYQGYWLRSQIIQTVEAQCNPRAEGFTSCLQEIKHAFAFQDWLFSGDALLGIFAPVVLFFAAGSLVFGIIQAISEYMLRNHLARKQELGLAAFDERPSDR